jgi:hypothetical protein
MEWHVYYQQGLPGPLDYPAPKLPAAGGGKFNMSRPKSQLDLIEMRSRESPSPGAYSFFAEPCSDLDRASGVFSSAQPKTTIEQAVFDKRDVPCPTLYSPISKEAGSYSPMASKISGGAEVRNSYLSNYY